MPTSPSQPSRQCPRRARRSTRSGLRAVALTVTAPLALALVVGGSPAVEAAEPTAQTYRQNATACLRSRDLPCAQKNWEAYVRLRPDDSKGIANLGIVMNRRDNDEGAIVQFERAIDLGEGTYDLFAYYADSLAKVGRTDEAIDWSYKTLTVRPRLVDVRSKLAKLLVGQTRHYEALSLLSSFDSQMRASGKPPYFEGQRIAIETALSRRGAAAAGPEQASLRLSPLGAHYHAPVAVGEERPTAFLVDTGASLLTVSDAFLASSKVAHKVTRAAVKMKLADGRAITGKRIIVSSLRVGPYELTDVAAFVCRDCALLLGQSALNRLDLTTSKVQGVEFLTLAARR